MVPGFSFFLLNGMYCLQSSHLQYPPSTHNVLAIYNHILRHIIFNQSRYLNNIILSIGLSIFFRYLKHEFIHRIPHFVSETRRRMQDFWDKNSVNASVEEMMLDKVGYIIQIHY